MDYLITLRIGPVQSFIAAARRTRDLWFGSYMLSEVSKAAAHAWLDAGVTELIWPAFGADLEQAKRRLAPCDATIGRQDSDERLDCLNSGAQLLARLGEGDPDRARQIINAGKAAARRRWEGFADQALAWLEGRRGGVTAQGDRVRQGQWDRQRGDLIEFAAAWARYSDDAHYGKAYQQLEQLLEARRRTRDFAPGAISPNDELGYRLPKSSLDGRQETVLTEALQQPGLAGPNRERIRLGLGDGSDQLDCPGLVKRLTAVRRLPGSQAAQSGGGDYRTLKEQFTPIPRIAADPWVRRVIEAGDRFEPLSPVMERLVRCELVTRVRGNFNTYTPFPYDGEFLYPFRIEAALARHSRSQDPLAKEICSALRELELRLTPLWQRHGAPCPYSAMLIGDGDGVGTWMRSASDRATHLRRSEAIAHFAERVPERVQRHRGHAIYAGGDDLLALIPLDSVVTCADALRSFFSACITKAVPAAPIGAPDSPTLSVGIAVAHFMTPMSRIRAIAKRAERIAKEGDGPAPQPRNGLAIIVAPRSGPPMTLRDRWDNHPHESIAQWQRLYQENQMPDRLAYDLKHLDRTLGTLANLSSDLRQLVESEIRRIIQRKRASGDTPIPTELETRLVERAKLRGISLLATELLIGRWLAQKVIE